MAQTLLIGLGGTGSRVVNKVVKELHKNKKAINNGEICCAVLDTNVNDNEAIIASDTGVPVIPTSKPQKIRDYLDIYHHLDMESWCPQSPAFLEQSMIDGASEMRVKSRIAFMDSKESGVIRELEMMINTVLQNGTDSKIRIMIVSSLSGGTGSGMFIQVALWLRKFLSESELMIRGIFILPDVFVNTVEGIRNNRTTAVRHYCNAYAAIRELNAITKIINDDSLELPEKIMLGDLFDSIKDAGSGNPVFDYAFFVDNKDENGVVLESISEYEQLVAQLVYMQLFAPMKNEMYSEEDNTFLAFHATPEPLYGSCGTSKAVYPTDSIKLYCAIRAAQDSLTTGWKRIDDEIEALKEEKKEREEDGIFSSETFDERLMFIKLFDEKTAVTPEEAGTDRFFLSISKDTKNEKKIKGEDEKVSIQYTDKVDDFIELLKSQKIDTLVTRKSGTDDYAINADAFVEEDHTVEQLANRVKSDESGLEEVLDTFDSKVEEYADEIVSSVFPYSMGEVKPSNKCTIYGIFAKENDMGKWDFIHPLSARYILYKLVKKMEESLKSIVLADERIEALTGGDRGIHFDNKATPKTETSPLEFLKSRKWFQKEGDFLDDFENRYAEFITTKIGLCEKYEKECLQVSVYRKLITRLNALISQIEAFFNKLDIVDKKLKEELTKNIAETDHVSGKTLFVLGTEEDKEAIYRSLDFDSGKSNAKINKSVIDAIYGRLCAEKRPSNSENAAYLNIGVIEAFIIDTVNAFKAKIDGDPNNRDLVDLDIYTALCRQSDARMKKQPQKEKRSGVLDSVDIAAGTITDKDNTAQRYKAAFINFKNDLYRMAAPFLTHTREKSDNKLGTVTTRPKTFWGFNPVVSETCSYVRTDLGANEELQADDAYPKNELYCYRAVYGMAAAYIPKFNEMSGGDYYTCYKAVVDQMVKESEGKAGSRAFVSTPHIDMNWHKILPYITEEKQRQDDLQFFHGFWLAIAYGTIGLDKDGNFYVKRKVDGGYGNYIEEKIPVLFKNAQDKMVPVSKTDVGRLITVLKTDKLFTESCIPELKAHFLAEIDEIATYVGTDVLKGLTNSNEDLNPINIVTRYNEGPKHNKYITAALIGALEKIASELAEKYDSERSEKKLEQAKFRICKKIFDSSKRTQGTAEIFGRWITMFKDATIEDYSAEGSANS